MREVVDQGFRVRLDLSGQVLAINVPEDRGYGGRGGSAEAPIAPKLEGIGERRFVSASMLAQKAKQFDDGLYAAVELAAQNGAGSFAGKASLLKSVATHFQNLREPPRGNGLDVLFAACRLGHVPAEVPQPLQASVERQVSHFLADPLLSKPIGFYTWSQPLSAIFQQDRALQTELVGAPSIEALLKALHADKAGRTSYEQYLNLVSRLTNPLVAPSLREQLRALDEGRLKVPEDGLAFFPPSRAHETELVKKLYGDRPIPEGFRLVDEMIKRIRAGRITLAPTSTSGWYDYQTFALEPLVIPDRAPEATHLRLSESYRKQLIELFKGILALTRETHIKQLEVPRVGAAAPVQPERPIIEIRPDLATEPLATFYRRRADSYRFIHGVLDAFFGREALAQMHRLTADGPVEPTLAAEIDTIESLFRGAAGSVDQQIGMALSGNAGASARDVAAFQMWTTTMDADPDLSRDVRMMVPLFYDLKREKTKVWVFLGWSSKPLVISYATPPKAQVFKGDQRVSENRGPIVRFASDYEEIGYPVTAEVYVTQILNRDEFRKLCDRYKTPSAILQNLK